MDILDPKSGLNIDDKNWKIYARNTAEPPHYVGRHCEIKNSIITEGCEIDGTISNSVISSGVKIGKGAVITGCNIMPGAHIEEGAKVSYSIVGPNAIIRKNAVVGGLLTGMEGGEWAITVVGPNAEVKENQVVPVKAMV